MKKITQILMLLLCFTNIVKAQDFAPGQQAQGLLESKNVTVDYSTGIFHYKVPLYTLKSGDFELPITLDYTGKGVKMDDRPGLLGYNWTLNTGGVVTRTVRGGIPDEDDLSGYIWKENDETPLEEDVTKVNLHQRDGECDIFTAVFGGQSVSFIIRRNGYDIYAEPLQRTNVRIECESRFGSQIDGWIVTDTQGNRYIYRQKEWTCNVMKQDANSLNGIKNKKYISSWYLTRIEPINSDSVRFYYLGENDYANSEDSHVDQFYSSYLTQYEYGYPLIINTFDFNKYKSEFDDAISRAMSYISDESVKLQIENQKYLLISYGQWVKNPNFDLVSEKLEQNFRIMGMAADFSRVEGISKELMTTLSNLETAYKGNWEISSSFAQAKNVLVKVLQDKEYVTERTVNNGTAYKVYTPVLMKITCKENLAFRYTTKNEQLANVEKQNYFNERISGFRLSYSNHIDLTSVIAYGKDSVDTRRTTFTYYAQPAGVKAMSDVYGYKKMYSDDKYAPFDDTLDEEYAKIGSLQEVTLSDGGRIRVDYELNRFEPEGYQSYGGIRIKSLLTDNQAENKVDTVTYRYEAGRPTFFVFYSNHENAQYASFTDRITYSKMRWKENAILCPGNNGMYYCCVYETVAGKGSQAYMFNLVENYYPSMAYPYWLCGLPVCTGTFNKDGYLERVLQNIYYTDGSVEENPYIPCSNPEAFVHNDSVSFTKSLPQMMADEEYMDRESLEDYYKNQQGLTFGGVTYYSPYRESYLTNIAPRIRNHYNPISYKLYFGGATLLKEQVEYRLPEGTYSDLMAWSPQGNPFSRKVYYYDNLSHNVAPTRVVEYNSDGDSCVTRICRVEDMTTASHEAISKMKEKNVCDPIVKQTVVKNGKLVGQTVSEYQVAETDGKCFYGVSKVASYIPDNSVPVLAENEDLLYDYGEECYKTEKTFRFDSVGHTSYLPIEIEEKGTQTAFYYDNFYKYLLLKAQNCSSEQIVAVDCERFMSTQEHLQHIQENRVLVDFANRFMKGFTLMDADDIPYKGYHEFRQTEYFRWGLRLVELLARKEAWNGKQSYIDEADNLLDSITTNNYWPLDNFLGWHIEVSNYYLYMGLPSPWDLTQEEFLEFLELMMTSVVDSNQLRDYFHSLSALSEESTEIAPVKVSVSSAHTHWKLYVLSSGRNNAIHYNIQYAGGSIGKVAQLQNSETNTLQVFDIDTSSYPDAESITIGYFSNVSYAVLLPAETLFEAASYDKYGRVVAKFDQDKRVEFYEYDAAGRLNRITDGEGHLLKESRYNTANH